MGFAEIGGHDHAGVWFGTAASWRDLHPAGEERSVAYGCASGRQVGFVQSGGLTRAASWSSTAESWEDLSRLLPPELSDSLAWAVSDRDGVVEVVGSAWNAEWGRREALLWRRLRVEARADFNGDFFLDFFDYDAFVGCFEGAGCPEGKTADFNGDGFVDFADYDAFVAAFEAGV